MPNKPFSQTKHALPIHSITPASFPALPLHRSRALEERKGPPPPKAPCHPRAGAGNVREARPSMKAPVRITQTRGVAFVCASSPCGVGTKTMPRVQPRVASRAAPHGGGPAYLPRLGAKRKAVAGMPRGRTAGDVQRPSTMTACAASASTRRADGLCGASAEQCPDRAGVCTWWRWTANRRPMIPITPTTHQRSDTHHPQHPHP
jgi:hypothetical protein